MHEGGWITFGLGHWLYGVLIWGVIIALIVMFFRSGRPKDD